MNTDALRSLDEPLAYLAWLTRTDLKPLSRWEASFSPGTVEALHQLGLQTTVVERSTLTGRRVRELLFAPSPSLLRSYAARFDGRRLEASPQNARFEGLLFGYPDCCVESYVAHGYLPNSLRRRDQRLLFHWACPGCAVTPTLLPRYRAAYRACHQARQGARTGVRDGWRRRLASGGHGRALVRLAAAAALASTAGLSGRAAGDPDPHVQPLSVWEDPDADGLASLEEQVLGTNGTHADQDANGIQDGTDLARLLAAALDTLPTKPDSPQSYVVHHLAFGLENCQVCGTPVNMGTMEVVNPLEDQSVHIPYICQHFLEHGSFTYAGSVHAGRVNPALLKMVLTSHGLGHLLAEPAALDADQDGLWDVEEPSFQCRPADPDTDGDHVLDGIAAARALRARLDALPRAPNEATGPRDRSFVVEHPMDGIELCPRCGDRVVMDVWVVVNPRNGVTVSVPSMALHYLEHGAFRWEGGQLAGGEGRIDPRQLRAALGAESEEHQFRVLWDADSDLLTDAEEQSLGSDSQQPDADRNQVLDGVDLARSVAAEIAALPTQPTHDRPYKEEHLLRGLETCDVCGATANMGWLVVVNPQAGLYAKVPHIGLHYLEHGGFSYAGDVHGADRADVTLLVAALHAKDPSHLKPVAGDADSDGLQDDEEACFHCDPATADTDGDGVPDGFRVAREQWRAVQALPRAAGPTTHAVDHLLRGLVTCDVCEATVNMGYVEIVNPPAQRKIEIPYLSLHFMENGAFTPCSGTRVDPVELDAVLRPAVVITREPGRVVLRWLGKAGRKYQVETANEPPGPWVAGATFLGEDRELNYWEPVADASPRRFYRIAAY